MPQRLCSVKSSWWWKSVSSQYLTEMKKNSCNCLLHKVLQKSWIRQWRGDTTMQRWYSIGLYHLLLGATIMMLIMIIVMIVIILQRLVLFFWWGRHWWWWWWYYSVTLLVGESNFNVLHLENLLEWHCFLCTAHTTLFSFYHIVYNVMLCWLLLC